jgi:hypothetical protein
MTEISVPCPSCGASIGLGDEFCQSCGAQVGEETKQAVTSAGRRARRRGRERARQTAKVTKAARWILVVAVLYAVFGTIMGFQAKSSVKTALEMLEDYDADDEYEVEGDVRTVAEWREAVRNEPTLVFVVNYVLAAIMLGLYFWGRVKPLPALVSALFVFVTVHFVAALVDPATIVQGILVKVLVIVALIGGIKAALAQRVAAEGAPAARHRR